MPGHTNLIVTGAFSDVITGFALRNEVTSHMGCSRPFGVAPALEEFASSIRRTLSGSLAQGFDRESRRHRRTLDTDLSRLTRLSGSGRQTGRRLHSVKRMLRKTTIYGGTS